MPASPAASTTRSRGPGSLLAVAALPVAVGLTGDEYADPVAFDSAYQSATVICAVLLALGGLLSWVTIRNPED